MSDQQGPQNAIPFGPYQLLRRIAVGGMAELYLGSEPRAARFVVLKRILPHLAVETDFVKMFLDEARIAVSLQHPNIIEVYELGQIDRSIFITMEWVEGMDLRRILHREQQRGGVVPPGIVAWCVARLCEGLYYAHTRLDDHTGEKLGIIHRDVSPQNVMVSYAGDVKLVDFGIAKATAWVSRSKPGVIKGKFLYLAPEQLTEEKLDSRCDLFALGTMMFELTTGKNPFHRPETEGVIAAIRSDEPPPAHTLHPGYPLSLSKIIQKCLVKKREQRFQTAKEIQLALEDAMLVDMPTTRTDVVNYVAGLFGSDAERTNLYVPENVKVTPKGRRTKTDPEAPVPEVSDDDDGDDDEATVGLTDPRKLFAERDAASTAHLTVGDASDVRSREIDPEVAKAAERLARSSMIDEEPAADDDEEATVLMEPPRALERPGPPVEADDRDARKISYEPVSDRARQTLESILAPAPPSLKRKAAAVAPVPAQARQADRRMMEEPSVQVDLEALLGPGGTLLPDADHTGAGNQEQEEETAYSVPMYPPTAAQPLVRPGPPIRDTEPAGRGSFGRRENQVTPPRSQAVARAANAAPSYRPSARLRSEKPNATHMHPVDIDSAELVREAHQARRREKKRVVKRRVAGDPDDQIDTIDQRSVEDVLSEEQSFDEARAPNPNRGLMLATIAMGVVALIMVVWLLWPARAPARPRLPAREAATDAVPAASKLSAAQNAPEIVTVQFRAAKSTEIYVDGTQVMPGDVRAVKPGPLSVGYRCAPVKKGQRSRDLTFNTRVPAEGVQPFLIDLSCR